MGAATVFMDNSRMPSATQFSPVVITSARLASVDVEMLVVPWFEGEKGSAVEDVDRATGGELVRALRSREFSARPFELFITPIVEGEWKSRRIAFIGGGVAASFTT